MRVTLTQAKKPGKLDMSSELEFNLSRSPEIGPGALKPNMGRGGVPVPDNTYLGDEELNIKSKKGKPEGGKNWSDLL